MCKEYNYAITRAASVVIRSILVTARPTKRVLHAWMLHHRARWWAMVRL